MAVKTVASKATLFAVSEGGFTKFASRGRERMENPLDAAVAAGIESRETVYDIPLAVAGPMLCDTQYNADTHNRIVKRVMTLLRRAAAYADVSLRTQVDDDAGLIKFAVRTEKVTRVRKAK